MNLLGWGMLVHFRDMKFSNQDIYKEGEKGRGFFFLTILETYTLFLHRVWQKY